MKFAQWFAGLLLLVLSTAPAWAGGTESCETVDWSGGKAVYRTVPCSQFDRPLVCTRSYMKDGSTLFEDIPCPAGGPQTVQEQEKSEVASQKKKCGKDFEKIRIGMTLNRYEECTDGLEFETETVSKGAVVETYRSTFYFIHAKDGRIVAFTRR